MPAPPPALPTHGRPQGPVDHALAEHRGARLAVGGGPWTSGWRFCWSTCSGGSAA